MKYLSLTSVFLLLACSSPKQNVAAQLSSTTQSSSSACPNIYDPLPLNRTDGKGTLIKDITTLPNGSYEYNGSSIYAFLETAKGMARVHLVETPSSSNGTTTLQVCGSNTVGDTASFSVESVASYELSKTAKALVGRNYSIHSISGHLLLSTSTTQYQGNVDLSVELGKASAFAIYQMSPTSYELRSYFRQTDTTKTEHVELVTELHFIPSAN